jgi:hypothetical protein
VGLVLCEAENRLALHAGVERLRRDEPFGKRLVRLRETPPELERPVLVVDADLVAALRLRVDTLTANLVLLGRKAERIPERLFHSDWLARRLERANRVPVVEELLVVELAMMEVLPPLRLLLATVVVEQVREEPARVALLRTGLEIVANAGPLGLALLRFLGLFTLLRRPTPRDVGPLRKQPAVELVEGKAILAVVVPNALE